MGPTSILQAFEFALYMDWKMYAYGFFLLSFMGKELGACLCDIFNYIGDDLLVCVRKHIFLDSN